MTEKIHYPTIWISDIHLGTRGCKAAFLFSFLKAHTCDTLYLVGDIIDGWRIKRGFYWPSVHNIIVRRILKMAEKQGTQVYYIAGNHDEFLREFISAHTLEMGNIQFRDEVFHTTLDGKKLWIVHGDAYDGVTKYHRWVAYLGDIGYNFLIWANTHVNWLRKLLGLRYWSLSRAIKNRVKSAVSYMFEFETTVAKEAAKRKVDGVICGHIHQVALKKINGIIYANCGDWVESCTAIVEDTDGTLRVIEWADVGHEIPVIEEDDENSDS